MVAVLKTAGIWTLAFALGVLLAMGEGYALLSALRTASGVISTLLVPALLSGVFYILVSRFVEGHILPLQRWVAYIPLMWGAAFVAVFLGYHYSLCRASPGETCHLVAAEFHLASLIVLESLVVAVSAFALLLGSMRIANGKVRGGARGRFALGALTVNIVFLVCWAPLLFYLYWAKPLAVEGFGWSALVNLVGGYAPVGLILLMILSVLAQISGTNKFFRGVK